jgi:hypothetical protein
MIQDVSPIRANSELQLGNANEIPTTIPISDVLDAVV